MMIFSVTMAHEYICLGYGGAWLSEQVTSNRCCNQDESTVRVTLLPNTGLSFLFRPPEVGIPGSSSRLF